MALPADVTIALPTKTFDFEIAKPTGALWWRHVRVVRRRFVVRARPLEQIKAIFEALDRLSRERRLSTTADLCFVVLGGAERDASFLTEEQADLLWQAFHEVNRLELPKKAVPAQELAAETAESPSTISSADSRSSPSASGESE
jgi:hypothetical protein